MNNMNNTLYNSMINRGGDGCLEALLAENDRRKRLRAQPPYDPLTGVGCWGDRVEVEVGPDTRYYVTIRKVTKAAGDDESLEIRGY